MREGIREARWTEMTVAQATVTDDAEYITRELCEPHDENRSLEEWSE